MIETVRLRIRPLELGDVAGLQAIWGDPVVMRFCGGEAGEDRLVQAVRSCAACQETHGFSPMAVVRKDDGLLIGACGLKTLPEADRAELIYHFRMDAWGQGYATESVLGVVGWARENLTLRFIEATIDPRNENSGRVLLKSGFQHLGDTWCEDTQALEPLFRMDLRED